MVKPVSRSQRRARLAARHHLAGPAESTLEAARSLVAVHSSDPVTVFLSMWARVKGFDTVHLEDDLYRTKDLVRHWGMRRTLWVVDRPFLGAMVAASTNSIAVSERKRTAKLLELGGVTEAGADWLDRVLPIVHEAVRERGPVFARQLTRDLPELSAKITFTNKAGRVMGSTGVASRALLQLGIESKVVRAKPAGSWVSGQYSWADMGDWLGEPIEPVSEREAAATTIRSWLRSFGPGTEADMKWWTGWTVSKLRHALADVGAVEVDLGEDGAGYLLPDDLDDVPSPATWTAFLPSLDATTMGWKERSFFMGGHDPILFDRNGNAGPTVWLEGRVVGGWSQRKDGEIVYRLLEDVGSVERDAIEMTAHRLQQWLGGITVTPRFRSPLDLELGI